MPNVTASNGQTFHLWGLPDMSAPEPEDSIAFTTLDNEMSEGNRSSALFGSNTGVRSWKLALPTLAGSSVPMPTVVDPYGATVSREQYVRNLYKYNRTTGIPFAYQWPPTNGQYYLVDFAPDPLSMAKTKNISLYASSITLKQRRIAGVTIFSVNEMSHSMDSGVIEVQVGDVTASSQNGLPTRRLNNTASTGYLHGDYSGFVPFLSTIYDVFIVMKIREATFSNNAGLFTQESGSGRYLIGTSGGTKFQDLSLSNYQYRLNGVLYAASNQVAPMNNTWGIVHLRFGSSINMSFGWQIGKDRTTAGTYAKADIAEYHFNSDASAAAGPLLLSEVREMNEYLAIKWGITI